MFARSPAKSQSQNEGSGSNAPAPSSAVPDDATAEELKALLDRQRLEMEGLIARLEAQKIADQAVVPELHEATLQEFQGRERLPQWMQDTLGALRQYVVAVPRPARPAGVGGDVASQASLGDTLAYRMWACLKQSHQAYRSRYTAQQQSAEARDTLDKLQWEEALARGGPQFTYRGVKFEKEGVLKWIASNGNHIPMAAKPSGDCRRCRDLRKPEGGRQHWHFQCPYWS